MNIFRLIRTLVFPHNAEDHRRSGDVPSRHAEEAAGVGIRQWMNADYLSGKEEARASTKRQAVILGCVAGSG